MESNTLFVKKLLYYTFGIVPIVAGLDKFTNILTNWTIYISPGMADALPMDVSAVMMVVGLIEIVAGALVLTRPAIGAIVVMAWLILIALLLIFSGIHLDVAVRDLVMAIAAFCLAKLSHPVLIKPKN